MAAAAGIARLRPALRAAALGVLVLAAPSLPARAELAVLAAERARLADELAGLRRIVPVQATDPARSAQLVVRLGQLEEELRQLTGRIEQLEYGQRTHVALRRPRWWRAGDSRPYLLSDLLSRRAVAPLSDGVVNGRKKF